MKDWKLTKRGERVRDGLMWLFFTGLLTWFFYIELSHFLR